jgi:hypothetical protein
MIAMCVSPAVVASVRRETKNQPKPGVLRSTRRDPRGRGENLACQLPELDLGYFDEKEGRVEPGPNPFVAKLLTMPPV